MWEAVPRLLAEIRYVVLATADADGNPWATPVFFAADGTHRLLWVSAPESRHSRNIAVRPEVALTVFDSTVPVGGAEAVYLEATAAAVDGPARQADLDLLNARVPAARKLGASSLAPAGPLWLYEATVARHFVLIRGGDQRFDNVTDARLEVGSPVQFPTGDG